MVRPGITQNLAVVVRRKNESDALPLVFQNCKITKFAMQAAHAGDWVFWKVEQVALPDGKMTARHGNGFRLTQFNRP